MEDYAGQAANDGFEAWVDQTTANSVMFAAYLS